MQRGKLKYEEKPLRDLKLFINSDNEIYCPLSVSSILEEVTIMINEGCTILNSTVQ
jgi:hypothetical protein